MLGTLNVHIDPDVFEPGIFSRQELLFIADHVGKPPVVAFADDLPPGVNRQQVEPALVRFYEMHELQQHRGVEWAGPAAIIDAVQNYLEWSEKTAEIKRRTRGRIAHASQFHWDETGKPYKSAIGADSCELVRTRILADGSREPLGVNLTGDAARALADLSDIAPWVKSDAKAKTVAADAVAEREGKPGGNGSFTCGICDHTEPFKSGARNSRMAALGRMARHLKNAKSDVSRHRMLYTKKFANR